MLAMAVTSALLTAGAWRNLGVPSGNTMAFDDLSSRAVSAECLAVNRQYKEIDWL